MRVRSPLRAHRRTRACTAVQHYSAMEDRFKQAIKAAIQRINQQQGRIPYNVQDDPDFANVGQPTAGITQCR